MSYVNIRMALRVYPENQNFLTNLIAWPELSQQPLITWAFKVLAAELIQKDVLLRDAELLHGDELAFFALVFA